MGTPITSRPSPSELERFRVGQPVSASHVRRWAQDLGFLRAHSAQHIGSFHYLPRTVLPAGTVNYPVLYCRRSGVKSIRAAITLHPDTDGERVQCDFKVSGTTVASWGDGDDIVVPSTRHRTAMRHFVEASSTSSGVVVLHAALTGTDQNQGLRSLGISEIPRASSSPLSDATDPGLNEAAIEARNRAHTPSSPDTADGLRRVMYELDRARTELYRVAQIATSEDTTFDTIQSTSVGYGPLDWRAHTGNPSFYLRPRRLYKTSTPNTCAFYIRYYWSGGTNAKVRATVTSLGTGSSATSVITLTTATTWTVQSAALNVPVDGVDQLCEVTFDADADGSVIDLSNIAVFDTET